MAGMILVCGHWIPVREDDAAADVAERITEKTGLSCSTTGNNVTIHEPPNLHEVEVTMEAAES